MGKLHEKFILDNLSGNSLSSGYNSTKVRTSVLSLSEIILRLKMIFMI